MDPTPASPRTPKFRRLVLKLSGEVLAQPGGGQPIDPRVLETVSKDVRELHSLGIQVGLVVGGGNIFRGLQGSGRGVDRTTGDTMGMLATVINGLAFMDCLERMDVPVRVQTAIPMPQVAEPFILRRAVRHLEKGRVVIFVAGTGNPYFSTDSTAALRGLEIGANAIFKATKVDGVYDKDPHVHPDARKYAELNYHDAIRERLNVMDSTSFSLCADNGLPILVFDMKTPGTIVRAALGENVGTLVGRVPTRYA